MTLKLKESSPIKHLGCYFLLSLKQKGKEFSYPDHSDDSCNASEAQNVQMPLEGIQSMPANKAVIR